MSITAAVFAVPLERLRTLQTIDDEDLLAEALEVLESETADEHVVDFDKMWHVVQFVLAPEFADRAGLHPISGGHEFGADMGYGPPRAFEPAEVVELSDRISGVTPEQLHERLDREELARNQIYPSIWQHDDELAMVEEEVVELLGELQALAETARHRGDALMVLFS